MRVSYLPLPHLRPFNPSKWASNPPFFLDTLYFRSLYHYSDNKTPAIVWGLSPTLSISQRWHSWRTRMWTRRPWASCYPGRRWRASTWPAGVGRPAVGGRATGSAGRGRGTVMRTGSARGCSSAGRTTVRPSQAAPGTRLTTVVRKYTHTDPILWRLRNLEIFCLFWGGFEETLPFQGYFWGNVSGIRRFRYWGSRKNN